MRTVSFIHPYGEQMASYRYRAMIPAAQIGASLNNPASDIVVLSKPFEVETAKAVKAQGSKLVVDFCDDHFCHAEIGPVYEELAQLADICVCPTAEMRKRIPAKRIAVIPDPYEMPEMPPHTGGGRLIWFGHTINLPSLHIYKDLPNLTIVSGPREGYNTTPYSPERLRAELAAANIAIFPTIMGHEYKSPNRVVNALRMGLFPVCDTHPAYHEFRKFIWQTDVATGLKWARVFASDLDGLVLQGQDYIREKFSPETVGRQWGELCASI